MSINVQEQIKHNPLFFWYGVINFVLTIFCAGISLFDHTEVLGKNIWLYPTKYYLSIGLFIWSIGLYLNYMSNQVQRNVLNTGFFVTTIIQTSIVLLQSIRGVSAFYNLSTPFNNLVFNIQTINYALFTILMIVTTYLFYTQKKNSKSQHFTWGIRTGMLVFLTGLLIGVFVLIMKTDAINLKETQFWYTIKGKNNKSGNFILPFFLGIHALQIIPLLSYYFFQSKKQVVNFSVFYFILMMIFLVMAILNIPIF